jgi:pimeloyl-ACP methyl ester carboxylesterase
MTDTITTDTLELAYEHSQPTGTDERTPVVLVHGFPDSPTSWAPIAKTLASNGHRVIAPYLRGFEPTRFLDDATPRSGQLAAIVQDLADLLDGLDLDKVILVGQDWGARAAQGIAATQPERVEHLVTLGGYAIGWDQTGQPPTYTQIQALWYQFFLQSGWGEGMLHAEPEGFSRHLWHTWSPTWHDADKAFEHAKLAIGGHEFAPIVLSAYRDDPTDDRYADLEQHLAERPTIDVATTIIYGADDGIEPDGPDLDADKEMFTDLIAQHVIEDAGHFVHAEKPDVVVDAIASR